MLYESNGTPDELEAIIKNVISPLEAFYQRVEQQTNDVVMVQPMLNGDVINLTWGDINGQVRKLSTYLQSLNLPAGSHIALASKNTAHWIIADIAIWLAGHVSVPIFTTLTADSVEKIMLHSDSKAIFIGKLDHWQKMDAGIPDDLVRITLPDCPSEIEKGAKTWAQIMLQYQPFQGMPKPGVDTLATIVYTTGTTGNTKGVMHTFRTMGITGELAAFIYKTDKNDRMLSFLPLSHVAERAAAEMPFLYRGIKLYFVKNIDSFAKDLRAASPTIFFAVPRIWTKIQHGVFKKMPEKKLRFLMKLPFISGAISKKIRLALGLNDVRIALSGAAPLSTSILSWYHKLGVGILEAYGMSENMAYSHSTRIGETIVGSVGRYNPAVQCKLDKQGQILVKSPTTMLGYYKDPELTKEILDKDGYLHTGDLGTIDNDGNLRITGRITELFKSSKGKYIAPAPIENRLLSNPYIEQVCVTGASLPQPIALVNLSEQAKEKLKDEAFKEELMQEFSALVENTNIVIDKHENLQCLVVVPEEWSIDNGFTTPTLKLKRRTIDDYYSKNYHQWSEKRQRVLYV